MLSLRALLATALLALTLTGSAGAFEDDESGPPMVGEYAVDVSSGPDDGLEIRDAHASVTAAEGGRLHVKLDLIAAGIDHDRAVTVRAAPCAGIGTEWHMVCRGGATRRLTIPAGTPAPATAELDVRAPKDPTQALRVTAGAAYADSVTLVVPGRAWRGPLAGRRVGATLGADAAAGLVTHRVMLKLSVFADDTAWVIGLVDAANSGATAQAIDLATRRCAQAACALKTGHLALKAGRDAAVDSPLLGALRRPGGATPVASVRATAGGGILAAATLPWPAPIRRHVQK